MSLEHVFVCGGLSLLGLAGAHWGYAHRGTRSGTLVSSHALICLVLSYGAVVLGGPWGFIAGLVEAELGTLTGGAQVTAWGVSVCWACVVPTVIFCSLTLTRPHLQTARVLGCLVGLVGIAGAFIVATQLFWWLLLFELLLLLSLYLLRLTSKSERINEAVAEMFFWTVFGSACLLLAFFLLATEGV